jgi:hypothetical protein
MPPASGTEQILSENATVRVVRFTARAKWSGKEVPARSSGPTLRKKRHYPVFSIS